METCQRFDDIVLFKARGLHLLHRKIGVYESAEIAVEPVGVGGLPKLQECAVTVIAYDPVRAVIDEHSCSRKRYEHLRTETRVQRIVLKDTADCQFITVSPSGDGELLPDDLFSDCLPVRGFHLLVLHRRGNFLGHGKRYDGISFHVKCFCNISCKALSVKYMEERRICHSSVSGIDSCLCPVHDEVGVPLKPSEPRRLLDLREIFLHPRRYSAARVSIDLILSVHIRSLADIEDSLRPVIEIVISLLKTHLRRQHQPHCQSDSERENLQPVPTSLCRQCPHRRGYVVSKIHVPVNLSRRR